MTSHQNIVCYRIITTEQFEELWRRAINAGVIDPQADRSQLDSLADFLSVDPYYFSLIDPAGEAIDLRWLTFTHGTTTRVEIWYSIVEDDRSVYLVSIEIYYPPQFGRPGFE